MRLVGESRPWLRPLHVLPHCYPSIATLDLSDRGRCEPPATHNQPYMRDSTDSSFECALADAPHHRGRWCKHVLLLRLQPLYERAENAGNLLQDLFTNHRVRCPV